jgi:two-component system LytT family response regulator
VIKAIIIDDNPFNRTVLSDVLSEYHSHVKIVAEAENGQEGLASISRLRPDLVFLDIEMPDMNGFEMLNHLSEINFQTIFTTAHSHYAIKAFRFNALDYLIKPINREELADALQKFTRQSHTTQQKEHLEIALKNAVATKPEEQILLLPTQKGSLRIPLKHIVKIEGDRNYSQLYFSNLSKELSSKTLKYFEDILLDKGFFRCHRSFLVNRIHVERIGSNHSVMLKDQSSIPISRRKKQAFLLWLSSEDDYSGDSIKPN